MAQGGGRIEAVQGDATVAADLDRLFEKVRTSAGRLDVLVASSGVSEYATLETTTEEHFDKLFDLNVKGTVFTVQGAVKLMDVGGSIVLLGSIAGSTGVDGYGTYAATKAAVRSYTQTWTAELAPLGIRVNTLSPGPTETPMFDGVSDDFRQMMTARIPLKRMGRPGEVADAALFLASTDSSYIEGAELRIDGGMTKV
ncbi:SDR family oxidoreductase [soil metagenome]